MNLPATSERKSLGPPVSPAVLCYGVAVKVDNAYGAYLKVRTEASPGFELFGKLGWVHATLNASIPGASASSSDSSFSYGAGAQYTFTGNWYVQGDYMSYYDKSG